jgi:heterodisulfide reductase subunit C
MLLSCSRLLLSLCHDLFPGRKKQTDSVFRFAARLDEHGRELKELFDPEYVLNPGVILNRDMDVHRKHLKPSPKASSLVDRCIECGFCESNCPAKDLSLTPRQRITVWKEIKRLEELPSKSVADTARLTDFKSLFNYYGEATCAADGMCQEKCPVKINTGDMIKQIRADEMQEGHPQANVRVSPTAPALPPTTASSHFCPPIRLIRQKPLPTFV